jgi:hypothetical protein
MHLWMTLEPAIVPGLVGVEIIEKTRQAIKLGAFSLSE